MFDVIKKAEYFGCLTRGFGDTEDPSLKGIQDAWIVSKLKGIRGLRIMEMGGGDSRILPMLEGNECWNIDKFEGNGQGPTSIDQPGHVSVIPTFFGDFDPRLPEVDMVFSISVVEHIPFEGYADVFKDIARCLKPGGITYHVVDLPLNDAPMQHSDIRIRSLIDAVEKSGLEWIEPVQTKEGVVFESDMAANSDLTMWKWTKICDKTKITAPLNQIVSIKLGARKPF